MTSHSQALTGLSAGTLYHYRVRSKDGVGNEAISTDQTFTTLPAPDTTPPAEITTLSFSNLGFNSVNLNWLAVGDDGTVGLASAYDIRVSTKAPAPDTAAWWNSAIPLSGAPAPKTAGLSQTYIAVGLTPQTAYYFAVRALDEVKNISELSLASIKSITTPAQPDLTAPAATTNLTAAVVTNSTVSLSWTAPGDDGVIGTAAGYDIRYGLVPLTEANFSSAAAALNPPTPKTAGLKESFTVSSLMANTIYYFALKTKDETNNISALSNLISTTTAAAAVSDTTEPIITNLSIIKRTASSATISWTTNEPANSVIQYGLSQSNLNLSVSTQTMDLSHELTLNGLTPRTQYYYKILSADSYGNTASSAVKSFKTRNQSVANLSVKSGSIILNWEYSKNDQPDGQLLILRRTDTYPLDPLAEAEYTVFSAPNLTPTSYTDTNSQSAATYYYSIFIGETNADPDLITYSEPASIAFTPTVIPAETPVPPAPPAPAPGGSSSSPTPAPADTTAPSAPAGLTAQGADKQISLKWTNPKDVDFVRTIILRKQDSFSSSVQDGKVVYEGNQEEFTDINLANNQDYYYTIYSFDRASNYSAPITALAKTIAGKISIEEKTAAAPTRQENQPPAPIVRNESQRVIAEEKKLTVKLDNNLAEKISGRILLQVEKNGQAWYVSPSDKKRYYLGRPADAFNLMKNLGLGIKQSLLDNYLKTKFPVRLAGKIMLAVEKNGQAYYVSPKTLTAYFLNRPADAFKIMRSLGLGITNANLRKIGVGEAR